MVPASDCKGLVWKKGGGTGGAFGSLMGRRSWKRRWFVLHDGALQYYRSEADWASGNARPLKEALYQLRHCTVNADVSSSGGGGDDGGGEDGLGIEASSPKASIDNDGLGIIVQPRSIEGGPRRLLLRVERKQDHDRWMAALEEAAHSCGSSAPVRNNPMMDATRSGRGVGRRQ